MRSRTLKPRDEEHGQGDDGVDRHRDEVGAGVEALLLGRLRRDEEDEQDRGGGLEDELRDRRALGADPVEGDALAGVGGHDAGQRAVGHVGHRVGEAQQDVGDARPGDLGAGSAEGVDEGQHHGDGQDGGAEDDVGAEAAPAGVRALGDVAEPEILDAVEEASDEEDVAGRDGGDEGHVRVEREEEGAHGGPDELGAELGEGEGDLLLEGDRKRHV